MARAARSHAAAVDRGWFHGPYVLALRRGFPWYKIPKSSSNGDRVQEANVIRHCQLHPIKGGTGDTIPARQRILHRMFDPLPMHLCSSYLFFPSVFFHSGFHHILFLPVSHVDDTKLPTMRLAANINDPPSKKESHAPPRIQVLKPPCFAFIR